MVWIADRAKGQVQFSDLSLLPLENIAMVHPAAAMAACICTFHPKWDERPLLFKGHKLPAA